MKYGRGNEALSDGFGRGENTATSPGTPGDTIEFLQRRFQGCRGQEQTEAFFSAHKNESIHVGSTGLLK
jgi:hypothetical protein